MPSFHFEVQLGQNGHCVVPLKVGGGKMAI